MNKFEIVLPTYNRSQAIDYLLKQYESYFDKYDFILSIHDSSPNDLTEEIVKKHPNYGKQINYFRYDPSLDVDSKTLICIKKTTAKYSMLVGDGWIIKVDELFSSGLLDKDFDILCLYDKGLKLYRSHFEKYIKEAKYYDSKEQFFEDNFWYLIMYGSSIISQKIIEEMDVENLCSKYKNLGFIYPSSLVESNASKLYVDCINILIKNPNKGEPGWMLKKDAVNTWCKNLTINFEKISCEYLPELSKNKIVRTTGKYTGFLTFKGLMTWKAKDNFNFKIYKKYKEYVLKTKACSRFTIFIVNLVPTFILKLMLKIFKKLFR